MLCLPKRWAHIRRDLDQMLDVEDDFLDQYIQDLTVLDDQPNSLIDTPNE